MIFPSSCVLVWGVGGICLSVVSLLIHIMPFCFNVLYKKNAYFIRLKFLHFHFWASFVQLSSSIGFKQWSLVGHCIGTALRWKSCCLPHSVSHYICVVYDTFYIYVLSKCMQVHEASEAMKWDTQEYCVDVLITFIQYIKSKCVC